MLACCFFAAAFGDAVGMAQFGVCPCSLVSLICNIIWNRDSSASLNPGVCLSTIPMLVFGECVGESHFPRSFTFKPGCGDWLHP